MRDSSLVLLTFAVLADVSRRKGQIPGADRFLILTGLAALEAGEREIAERCRELVLADNPRHLLKTWPSLGAAAEDPRFVPFRRRLDRFCSFERGEHLLQGLGIDPRSYLPANPSFRAAVRELLGE
jgi:hypothetical protein